MSDDLAAFLAARLDEDEQWAKDLIAYDRGDVSGMYGIAQRMLREASAMRRRLALYVDAKEALAAALEKAPSEGDPATAHSYVRERINVNQASGRFTVLEMSVRLDATVYSDYPGYRPEWAPE